MKLRAWQAACVAKARAQFAAGVDRYLCLASPGAGKTVMAAELARHLFADDAIDRVVCFSPSIQIARNFEATLAAVTGRRMDGGLASVGRSLLYHQLKGLDADFWGLFEDHRVLVIFDEIHHCGGTNLANATAWGAEILQHIRDQAPFILSLSGTPWRTDNIPVVLSRYNADGIVCDYVYGLADAIGERVCREPHLIAVDNSRYRLVDGGEHDTFSSLTALLSDQRIGYGEVLKNEALVTQVLRLARRQLQQLQRRDASAAGLVVASSVAHALWIRDIFQRVFRETPSVVSHRDKHASDRIERFRHNQAHWIIAVGMISEGTDIPRLQVCCHLSVVKTELYFRQILGRVLRVTKKNLDRGFLFFPAEPTLLQFAHRLVEDIPAGRSSLTVTEGSDDVIVDTSRVPAVSQDDHPVPGTPVDSASMEVEGRSGAHLMIDGPAGSVLGVDTGRLPPRLEVFGRFRQEVIRLHLASP